MQRLALDPRVRGAGVVMAYGGSGFLMSAAGLGEYPLPLAMGLICAATGWRTLVMSLGAMVGYPAFWGQAGNQGIVWSAVAGVLALMVGKREESREQPLMIPAIAAFLTAASGLSFFLILGERLPPAVYVLRIALTFFSGVLFTQAGRCRDTVTDWVVGGVAVLALAQVTVGKHWNLGCIASGLMAVGAAFPAAALAGLGMDLAQVTAVPMTAVLCLAWFVKMIPFDKKWQHYAAPGFSCLAVCAACGIWDLVPLMGVTVGGLCGVLLPPRPSVTRRRGETGAAQVRLELGAGVLNAMQQLILEIPEPVVDEGALLDKVRQRACGGCPARSGCVQRDSLGPELLRDPLEADCARQGRMISELRQAREQWKRMTADSKRQAEYRAALVQQYRFLGGYLQSLADKLPRGAQRGAIAFRMEVSARSRGKQRANGDRCMAFSGGECAYYVVLCDGMGTGLGAAQEAHSAARLLKQMLTAGFPAEYALGSLNSLLALRGSAGAVTVDLARIQLDTGHAHIYKWGAAPSFLLSRTGAEKIGTATPPPGISVQEDPCAAKKLSLRRGEVLILLSDGVDGEGVLRLSDLSPDMPPGELAANFLERGCGSGEDDATAAVIRLRPLSPPAS